MQVALDDYVWAAGIATDLVNTTAEVWRGDDRLPDLAALVAFAEQRDDRTVDGGGPAALADLARRGHAGVLEDVRALRISVRDLIDRPDHDHLVAGATGLTTAVRGVTLIRDPVVGGCARWAARLHPRATVADALSAICGIGILGVVHTLGEKRFRACGAPTCRGAFIDTTRPGRRRYCMPGLCGNRVNVANHRARRAAMSPDGHGHEQPG